MSRYNKTFTIDQRFHSLCVTSKIEKSIREKYSQILWTPRIRTISPVAIGMPVNLYLSIYVCLSVYVFFSAIVSRTFFSQNYLSGLCYGLFIGKLENLEEQELIFRWGSTLANFPLLRQSSIANLVHLETTNQSQNVHWHPKGFYQK